MSDSHGGSKIPLMGIVNAITHTTHEHGVHLQVKQLIILAAVMVAAFFIFDIEQTVLNFEMVAYLTPLWLPAILLEPTWGRYLQAKRMEFISGQKYVLLEIRMPRDTAKTPLAMETFFSNMHIGSGESTWYKTMVQGSVRPWWSLEVASIGGRIHFYIWTRVGFRRLIESSLYAQYPDIEIIEAEDYSRMTDPANHHYNMWGCEYQKTKSDPLPIKTYTDYGLTPGHKPEENVDPMGQMLELMGSLGPGEELWLQMIIRVAKKDTEPKKPIAKGSPSYGWSQASDLVKTLRMQAANIGSQDPEEAVRSIPATRSQNDIISSVENNVMKQAFDVGMRAIYCAPEDKFNGGMIGATINLFKPFNNELKNTIGLQGTWSGMFNDFPWEDPSGHHHHVVNEQVTRMYRQRAFYHLPYVGAWSVMSTEELATIFHVPSRGVTTPNLPRIQSATAGAPSNLPQ